MDLMMLMIGEEPIELRAMPPTSQRVIRWDGLEIIATPRGFYVLNRSGERRELRFLVGRNPDQFFLPVIDSGGVFSFFDPN